MNDLQQMKEILLGPFSAEANASLIRLDAAARADAALALDALIEPHYYRVFVKHNTRVYRDAEVSGNEYGEVRKQWDAWHAAGMAARSAA